MSIFIHCVSMLMKKIYSLGRSAMKAFSIIVVLTFSQNLLSQPTISSFLLHPACRNKRNNQRNQFQSDRG